MIFEIQNLLNGCQYTKTVYSQHLNVKEKKKKEKDNEKEKAASIYRFLLYKSFNETNVNKLQKEAKDDGALFKTDLYFKVFKTFYF